MIFSFKFKSKRVDKKKKVYTGALCGLGFDKKRNSPLYTENDVEDVFEVNFDEKDLTLVNTAFLFSYYILK
jgi:ATP-dependent RNA helicase TDRD9